MFSFNKNSNTWTFIAPNNFAIIAFNQDDKPFILEEGTIDIDHLDGSAHDGDGDEKQLRVKIDCASNLISFETISSDYHFWKDTETCTKKGCLGYVEELLNNILNFPDFETSVSLDNENEDIEAFLWKLNFVKKEYPELF